MRIYYSSGSVLTDDETAQTLLEYAALLARLGTADTVTIATVGTVNGQTSTEFLVGPASELVASEEEAYEAAPDNSAALEYMRTRMAAVRRSPDQDEGLVEGIDY